jgi:hypothetical protein
MFVRMMSLAAIAAAVLLGGPSGARASKPADLPLDLTGRCVQGAREQPQTHVSFYPPGEDTRSCPCLDALSPSLFAMLAELCARGDDDAACDPHWLAEVGRLYLIAQQCNKTGDHAMAKNCLRQIGLICPQSSYARLAAQDLAQMDRVEPRGEVIVLVSRTHSGPLAVEVDGQGQSPGDWWQERVLQAAREIEAIRLVSGFLGEGGDAPPTAPLSPEQERIDQLLRSTVPLEIHLHEALASPQSRNGLARWLANAMDIDIQSTGIRAAVSIGGRLYRIELEW